MGLGTIIVIILILLLIGIMPAWPHARSFGYAPASIVGLALVVVIFFVLTGQF